MRRGQEEIEYKRRKKGDDKRMGRKRRSGSKKGEKT